MENTHTHAPPYKLLIFSLLIVRFLAHMHLTFTPQKINFKAKGKKENTWDLLFFKKQKNEKTRWDSFPFWKNKDWKF